MSSFARFSLKAPMASWSESGVLVKPTERTPTWSALVGLVGAAFGWSREDDRLAKFSADYAPVLVVRKAGEVFEDYHTIQTPEASQALRRRARTRLDEMSVPSIHSTITRREYVSDSVCDIILFPLTSTPVVTPEEIAAALANPVFPLYAGRRSCPLGPLRCVVENGDADTAVNEATHWDSRIRSSRKPSLVRERRDLLVGPRQFFIRKECIA